MTSNLLRSLLCASALLAAVASTGVAQGMPSPGTPAKPAYVAPAPPKSESRALLLSLGHTAVASTVGITALFWSEENAPALSFPSYLLAYYGVFMAPSLGSYYARDNDRIERGLAIRLLGGSFVLGSAFGQILPEEDPVTGEWDTSWKWDWAGITGIALIGAGMTYSIATAPQSVEEYNQTHSGSAAVSMSPTYSPKDRAVGVQVGMRF